VTRTPTTRLVAGREISERIGSRTLRVTTAIMTLLVVAGVVIPALVSSPEQPTSVGLLGERAQALAPALRHTAHAAKVKIALTHLDDARAARSELKDGSLDVALTLGPRAATAEVAQSLSSTMRALLAATIDGVHQQRVLRQAGVPPVKIVAAQTPVPLATVAIQPPPSHEAARDIAALAAGLLLYVTVAMYGTAVATGVAQEKTSRTAEVLLAAVRPRQLLAGKVVGIGLCGLAQLAIPVVAGLIANAVVHSAQIPSTVWLLLPASLLWFVLGYALYSLGYAAAGATIARQEEVQFATAPFAFPLLAGYLLVYAAIGSPHSTIIRVLSFLPPLAPSLMPARIALGGVAWWETPLAVLLTLVSIYGMVRLASRVYTGALVRSGPRLSLRTALALGRQPGAQGQQRS
jgi:ABC-2 type transport system permease protein